MWAGLRALKETFLDPFNRMTLSCVHLRDEQLLHDTQVIYILDWVSISLMIIPKGDGNYQDMDIMAWNIAGSEPWAFRSLYFQYTTFLKGQEVTTPLHHSQLMVNYRTRASSSILSPFRDTCNLRISPGPHHNRYGEIRIRIFSWGNKGTQKKCQIRKKNSWKRNKKIRRTLKKEINKNLKVQGPIIGRCWFL